MKKSTSKSSFTSTKSTAEKNVVDHKKEDAIIKDYVGQMYGVKIQFLSMLGNTEKEAMEEFYKATTEKEQREIAYKYLHVVAQYETKCDADVESIISSLESELKAIGANTAIVPKLKQTYYDEKVSKKAYYINQFEEKTGQTKDKK